MKIPSGQVTEYDEVAAMHYAAFRPALHAPILADCLAENQRYPWGLDIGCGTGHSSVALAQYCDQVLATDPSEEMLRQAVNHPDISYAHGALRHLDLPDHHFALITFAGSLFYAKSQSLLDEVVRVAATNAQIIVYDFDIQVDEILRLLDIPSPPQMDHPYDHEVNFSDLDQQSLHKVKELKKLRAIDATVSELAHILLSSKEHYHVLAKRFGAQHLHAILCDQLATRLQRTQTALPAMTYLTQYLLTE